MQDILKLKLCLYLLLLWNETSSASKRDQSMRNCDDTTWPMGCSCTKNGDQRSKGRILLQAFTSKRSSSATKALVLEEEFLNEAGGSESSQVEKSFKPSQSAEDSRIYKTLLSWMASMHAGDLPRSVRSWLQKASPKSPVKELSSQEFSTVKSDNSAQESQSSIQGELESLLFLIICVLIFAVVVFYVVSPEVVASMCRNALKALLSLNPCGDGSGHVSTKGKTADSPISEGGGLGGLGQAAAQSAKASGSPFSEDGYFCQDLMVPSGHECVLIFPIRPESSSYEVTDGGGSAVLRVVDGEAAGKIGDNGLPRRALVIGSSDVIAQCRRSNSSMPGSAIREFELLQEDGTTWGRVWYEHHEDSEDKCTIETKGKELLFLIGSAKHCALNLVDSQGGLLATSESLHDRPGLARLRVAPAGDVGLVLCSLICLQHLSSE
eukprot:TRINITY_DN2977_c4_g1_i1.p1 TRINITY_DN2977_c4_g1~~TRINITY_DN2977_c4_g1_i1.p1  ORF type:complete len:437 (-),score=50.56 TRINITY_DN2977_c4_g1_i1:120-1430(-)